MAHKPTRNPKRNGTLIQSTTSYGYENFEEENSKARANRSMDIPTADELIRDINRLAKPDHMHIYAFLRNNGISANFFSRSATSVHFDFDQLPNALKWRLSIHLKMLNSAQHRKTVIEQSATQHQAIIQQLDHQLEEHGGVMSKEQLEQLESERPCAVSERLKFQKMRDLQP